MENCGLHWQKHRSSAFSLLPENLETEISKGIERRSGKSHGTGVVVEK